MTFAADFFCMFLVMFADVSWMIVQRKHRSTTYMLYMLQFVCNIIIDVQMHAEECGRQLMENGLVTLLNNVHSTCTVDIECGRSSRE